MTTSQNPKWTGWIFLLLVLLFGIMVYRDALLPGRVLFTTDDNIGAVAQRKATFPHAFLGGWYDMSVAGYPLFTPISSTNLLLWMLSPRAFVNWIHIIDLVVGSWFIMLFLRLRGVGWIAATLGALLSCWLGSTFFLTFAGHIGKFGVVMFAGIYLYLVERAVRDRSIAFAVMAGAAMGGMFIEQTDSALFFALVLGPYALFRGWQEFRFSVGGHARVILPLVAITAMVALHSVYSAISFYRMDKPVVTEEQNWQELWDYCTQWSWPPSETIEFIAPGYMGWRSGEPTGPYWGALGRSPQWQPQFGPNGMNFKLETFYKGFLPIMFLALGIYGSLIRKRDDVQARQQVIFWTAAMVVTFVLASGKHLPFYRLFFELPGISSIRNPVKFMQITQIAMGILAAFGLDYWLATLRRGTVKNDADRDVLASFTKGVGIAAVLFSLATLVLMIQSGGSVSTFTAAGWQGMAEAIVKTRLSAMAHLSVMAWLSYGLLRMGRVSGQIKHSSWRHLGGAVLVVVMVDQLMISWRYVQSVETSSLVSEGALIPRLRQDLGVQRAYLWSPPAGAQDQWGGLYNQWMTILFPYHQIPLANITQMRMPDDYKLYFDAMNQRPLQMWAQMGVGLSLVPSDFWGRIRNDPSLRGFFEPVAGFSIVPAGKTGATTVAAPPQQAGQHLLLRYLKPSDRYSLISAWRSADLVESVRLLPELEPLTVALVDPDAASAWPASGEPGRTGTVVVTSYRPGRIELKVTVDRAAVLRASDKYTPDWKAWVDGVERPVVRTDAVFLGVMMEPSAQPQTVVLEFSPSRSTLYLQLAGMGLALLAFGAVVVRGGFKPRESAD